MTSLAQSKKIAAIFDDPIKFVGLYWPEIRLYDKQIEILRSLRDNSETFVHAGAALGKDFISSLGVLWFFCSRAPCKVIISSASEDHLRTVLWGEIQERIRTSRFPLHIKVDYMRVRRWTDAKETDFDPQSYIEGRVTNRVEAFAGVHLDNDKPRVLCLFDEASSISDAFFESAQSWAHRILVIGNPLNTTNFFYKQCKAGNRQRPEHVRSLTPGLLRKVIHIGSKHSPDVIWHKTRLDQGLRPKPIPTKLRIPGVVTWEEHLQRRVNWDEYNITTRDEGYFYEGAETQLYPREWLDAAEMAHLNLEISGKMRKAKAIGVDGGEGRANSAWTVVDELGILWHEAFQTPDTMKIAGHTIRLMKQWGVPPQKVFFDRGGGGKQIADRLREQGYDVQMVSFGEAATPIIGTKTKRLQDRKEVYDDRQAYKNRRAEMYGILRELLNPSLRNPVFAIPAIYTALRDELTPLPLLYDSEGRMYLPPKSRMAGNTNKNLVTIEEILGHSPDRADATVLAAYALQSKSRRVLGAFA